MLARMITKIADVGARLASAFACASMLLFALGALPQDALAADDGDGIPEGVLVLCDNPFAIDCGHNHEASDWASAEGASVSALAGAPSNQSDASANCLDDAALLPDVSLSCSERSEESSAPQSTVASSVDPAAPQCVKTPSTATASTIASNDEANTYVSTAASDGARVIVEDEGLFRHECASVLAEVKDGMSREEFDRIISSVGGLSADDVTDDDLSYGLVRLVITDSASVLQAIERVNRLEGFSNAQPNYVYRAYGEEESHTMIDDYYGTRQWGLYNANVFSAWDLAKTNGSVAVAVIDTGADLDHADLAPNIVAARNVYSNSNTVEDQVGHGTHVAGIIAGVANNGEGIAGSSYNAGLVIIKATSYKSSDFDTASLVRAYAWLETLDSSGKTVAEHYNVRIVNLSIGGFDEARVANVADDALNQAIKKARDEFGLLTIAAAGNNLPYGEPYYAYPGDSDACMSIMNLTETYNDDGEPIGFDLDPTSNYNVPGTNYKDLCAPGTDIYSTWINGGYAIDSGTSMAAPFVAGVAALVLAVNPYLTPQMLMSILEASASDLGDEGWDEVYGYGAINAAAAVRLANAARVDGFRVIGVGGSAGYSMSLGLDMADDGNGCSWDIWQNGGYASIDADGVLHGWDAGSVTVVSTCITATGAEISATKIVHVLDSKIVGDSVVSSGGKSSPYTTTDPEWTWVWKVENLTGGAHIDQDAVLVADKPGIVYVSATCASNTDIVIEHRVEIVA